jgi:parallel beta-helix repeat protein
MACGVNVTSATAFVRAGTYAESVIVRSNKNPGWMTVRNYPGETPVLSGAGVRAYGVTVSNTRLVAVSGFRFVRFSTAGFWYGNRSRRSLCSDSSFSNCGIGVQFLGVARSNTLSRCEIFRSSTFGVLLDINSVSNEIRESVIRSSGDAGIRQGLTVIDDGTRVVRNIVISNTGSGILCWGRRISYQSNILAFNGIHGLDVSGDFGLEVRRNAFYRNANHGINNYMADFGALIYNNTSIQNSFINDIGSGINSRYSAFVRNNICAYQLGPYNGFGVVSGAGANVKAAYCDVFGNAGGPYGGTAGAGTGTITVDPQFVFSGPDVRASSFLLLKETSPCRDAGTNVGESWIGPAPDIGWKEYEFSGPFFVDDNSGNDANSGTIELPFRTIQRAVDRLTSGICVTFATCYVFPGTYPETATIRSNRFQQSGASIVFIALSNRWPLVTGRMTVTNAANIRFEKLLFGTTSGPAVVLTGSASNIVVANSLFSNNPVAVRVEGQACGNTLLGNVVRFASTAGIILAGAVRENSIRGNDILRCSTDGIVISATGRNLVVQNRVMSNSSVSGGGVRLTAGSVDVRSNVFLRNSTAVRVLSGITSATLQRNAVFGQSAEGFAVSNVNTVMLHNTLASNARISGNGITIGPGLSGVRGINNIIAYGNSGAGISYSGGGFPDLRYNCVSGNPLAYSGCSDLAGGFTNNPKVFSFDVALPKFLFLSNNSPCLDTGLSYGQGYKSSAPDIGWKEIFNGGPFFVSKTGDDNNSGSFEDPFRTVQKGVARVSSGIEVTVASCYVMAGTYTQSVVVSSNKNPSWMVLANYPGQTPSLWGAGTSVGGIKVTNAAYVQIDGIRLRRYTTAGIWVAGSSSPIRILSVQVSNCQNGILLGSGIVNSLFQSNRIERCPANGIDMTSGNKFNLFQGNYISSNHGMGIDFQSTCSSNTVSGNFILSNTGTSGILLNGYANLNGNVICSNVFVRNAIGTELTGNQFVYRNAFFRNTSDGLKSWGAFTLYNNTSVSNGGMGYFITPNADNSICLNNIAMGNVGWGFGTSGGGPTGVRLGFSDSYLNTGGNYSGSIGYDSWDNLQVDPPFLSFDVWSTNFLRLSAGSFCIDAGTNAGFFYRGGAPDQGWKETDTVNYGPFFVSTNRAVSYDYGVGTFARPFRTLQRSVARMSPGYEVTCATTYVFPHLFKERPTVNSNETGQMMSFIKLSNTPPQMIGGAYGWLLSGPSYVQVRGFRITNVTVQGILLDNASDCSILSNQVRSSSSNEIQLRNSIRCRVTGNQVAGSPALSVFGACRSNMVSENYFISGNNPALRMSQLRDYNAVLQNKFSSAVTNGIILQNATNQFVSANWFSNSRTPIILQSLDSSNRVSQNVLTGPSVTAGILFSGLNGHNSVMSNWITNAPVGILLQAGQQSNLIQGNIIRRSVQSGIQIQGAASYGNTIRGNDVRLGTGNGIALTNGASGNDVILNVVQSNFAPGFSAVFLDGPANICASNILIVNRTGVLVNGTSCTLARNAVYGSTNTGVLVRGTGAVLFHNSFVSNGTRRGSSCEISNAATGTLLVNNIFYGTKLRYGVLLRTGGSATLKFNDFYSNKAGHYSNIAPTGAASKTNNPLFGTLSYPSLQFLKPSSVSPVIDAGTNYAAGTWFGYQGTAPDEGWKEYVLPPAATTILSVSYVSTNWLDLTWTGIPNVASYTLFMNTSNDSNTATAVLGTLAGTVSGSLTNLNGNKTYYFWVRTYNESGASGLSPVMTGSTFPPAPFAPILVSQVSVSTGRIDVTWQDVANETSYTLYRSTTASTSSAVKVCGTAAGVLTASATNLSSGTTYYFWVKAFNAGGASGFSAPGSATTFSSGTATLTMIKSISNIQLAGTLARPIPGARITYKLWYSNASSPGLTVAVYDRLNTNFVYLPGTSQNFSGIWTNQFSTSVAPVNAYDSASYTSTEPAPASVKWLRWKTPVLGVGEKGVIVYQVMVK